MAAVAAFMALAVAGCSGGLSQGGPDASLRYARSEAVVRLTSSGLGPVGAGMPYSKETLQRALPGFTFDTVKAMNNGELKWYLAAFANGLQQVQFEPDARGTLVSRIHLVGQEAAGPGGERLGMTFAETNGSALSCRPGGGEWAGMALCKSGDGALTYIYAPEAYDGPDGKLPPDAHLAKARLVRMIWQSPAG